MNIDIDIETLTSLIEPLKDTYSTYESIPSGFKKSMLSRDFLLILIPISTMSEIQKKILSSAIESKSPLVEFLRIKNDINAKLRNFETFNIDPSFESLISELWPYIKCSLQLDRLLDQRNISEALNVLTETRWLISEPELLVKYEVLITSNLSDWKKLIEKIFWDDQDFTNAKYYKSDQVIKNKTIYQNLIKNTQKARTESDIPHYFSLPSYDTSKNNYILNDYYRVRLSYYTLGCDKTPYILKTIENLLKEIINLDIILNEADQKRLYKEIQDNISIYEKCTSKTISPNLKREIEKRFNEPKSDSQRRASVDASKQAIMSDISDLNVDLSREPIPQRRASVDMSEGTVVSNLSEIKGVKSGVKLESGTEYQKYQKYQTTIENLKKNISILNFDRINRILSLIYVIQGVYLFMYDYKVRSRVYIPHGLHIMNIFGTFWSIVTMIDGFNIYLNLWWCIVSWWTFDLFKNTRHPLYSLSIMTGCYSTLIIIITKIMNP